MIIKIFSTSVMTTKLFSPYVVPAVSTLKKFFVKEKIISGTVHLRFALNSDVFFEDHTNKVIAIF